MNISNDISQNQNELEETSSSRRKSLWTVTRKLTSLIVVLTALGFVTFVMIAANSLRSNMNDMAVENYTAMTELLADTVSGAIRWNNADQVEATFNKVSKAGDSPLIALNAYGLPDNPKSLSAEFNLPDRMDAALTERLSSAAVTQPEAATVESTGAQLIVTIPVTLDKNSNAIGYLVTAWDTNNIALVVARKTRDLHLIGILSVAVLAVLLGLVISRGIGRRIVSSVDIANEIAIGNLNNNFEVNSYDELGQLGRALNAVQTSLKAGDDSERRAGEFGRIKQALDCATASTLLADAEHNIAYTNEACNRLLTENSVILESSSTQNLSASALIGQSLDIFSRYDGLSGAEVGQQTHNMKFDITEEDLSLRVNVTPVIDDGGNRLGTIVEWLDRTREVNAEREVQAMVDAAAEGDFSRRIQSEKMKGFHAQIANMLNNLAEISEVGMNDTLQVLRALASGHLSARIESNHKGVFAELRENCNATSYKLTDIVGQIREAAVAVSNGANEIAKGNMDLSSRTEQQAAHLEETVAAMEQMSRTVRKNSDNAHRANELMGEARAEAERGGDVAGKAVLAVNEISEASRKIADIIGVIDEIAFQTNLLALNASVEAARAGDKGRGFAVVASEVRDLAGRSATAAKEIKELIDDSVSKVVEGERLVGESGDALNAIVGSVKKVSDIVSNIASAGIEQTQDINQINVAISQIDEMTQRNAALVEQASSSSQTVDQQAKDLDELVGFFTIDSTSNSAGEYDSNQGADTQQHPSRAA